MSVTRWAWLAALLTVVATALPSGERHARAAALLLRLGGGEPAGLAAYGVEPVEVEAGELVTPNGKVRTRIYKPSGRLDRPAVVLVHGVHRLGVEEPRMARFARSVAASGFVIYTPEVTELTDYRIVPSSIDTIGAAAVELGKLAGRARVGVMGFSFAGGLSLMTAADPRFRDHIGLVASIGGHHDLERVCRFFVENRIPRADGGTLSMKAHDYGLLVLLYGYTGEFFSAADVPAAHEALRLWLANDRDRARQAAEPLSPGGKQRMELIFAEKTAEFSGELLAALERQRSLMAPVSPATRIHDVTASIFLLHGEGDNVIPPSEALWLARSARPSSLRAALVSQAIQHVELQGKPPALEQARVVSFMASLLHEAETLPRR